jgi:uncharacterized protein (UPF0276 family)
VGEALRGVGLGWRREFAHDLLSQPDAVSFVEVVAETCWARDRLRDEVRAAAERWPVIPHGVKLSLGSADGIDADHARRLGRLAQELHSPWITEHASFTRAGDRDIGHLTQLPRTRAAVRTLARNVNVLRRAVGDVPIALENVAWTTAWPDDEMDEATFYQEVCAATGCPLLLDLGNLHANARNEGVDPAAVLDAFPLERVAMVHIAGGDWHDVSGARFFVDSHAHPVPAAVFALLQRLVARRGAVPVILERDANFPPFEALRAELRRAQEMLTAPGPAAAMRPGVTSPEGPPEADLARAQSHLAALLTAPEAPAACAPFDPRQVAFARDVLQRKRIDDALPLLPRLAARAGDARPAAWAAVAERPRAAHLVALNDAWRIAELSESLPELRTAARLDGLVLRARSHGHDGARRPRWGAYVSRRDLGDGRHAWVYKGLGASAAVRVIVR